jgi:hypothetical protein
VVALEEEEVKMQQSVPPVRQDKVMQVEVLHLVI